MNVYQCNNMTIVSLPNPFQIQQVMDEDEMGRETPLHPSMLPSIPSTSKAGVQAATKISVVDVLAEELTPLLQNVENIANLVLISMVSNTLVPRGDRSRRAIFSQHALLDHNPWNW